MMMKKDHFEKSQGFVEKRSREISTRRREIFIRSGLVEQKTAGNIYKNYSFLLKNSANS
jgi:hypothetical protein